MAAHLIFAATDDRPIMVSSETICKEHRSMPAGRHPDHAPLELERFVPYQLSIVSNTVSQAIADDYQARHDLGVTEWRVMAVLARFDGLSAREVAERTAMDKVAVRRRLEDPRRGGADGAAAGAGVAGPIGTGGAGLAAAHPRQADAAGRPRELSGPLSISRDLAARDAS